MDRRRALLVDAFTDVPFAGNAAGVVPDGHGLTESQMQQIANELGASETAFVLPSDGADLRLRYFTPTTEVSLCGHATVASLAHRHAVGDLAVGEHTVETGAGVLDVAVTDDGRVWLTGTDPTVREVSVENDRLEAALDIDAAAREAVSELPIAVASTGLPFLVVPVGYFADVNEADPDFPLVESLADDVGAAGVYLFTFETVTADATLHARAFVPGAGIPEDPVTGTASGAVAAYLERMEAFDELPEELTCEQGYAVDRPGRVSVRFETDGVSVGGQAATALDGEIAVPSDKDDDILEA